MTWLRVLSVFAAYTTGFVLWIGVLEPGGARTASELLFWGGHIGVGFWVGRSWALLLPAWSVFLMIPFAQTPQFHYGDVAAVAIVLVALVEEVLVLLGIGTRKFFSLATT